ADDFKAHVLDANFLADGRLAAEEFAHERLADQTDLAVAADVTVGEGVAFSHVCPVTHRQKSRGGAIDVQGHPIAVAVHHLRARPHHGSHAPDCGAFLLTSV